MVGPPGTLAVPRIRKVLAGEEKRVNFEWIFGWSLPFILPAATFYHFCLTLTIVQPFQLGLKRKILRILRKRCRCVEKPSNTACLGQDYRILC